MGWQGHLATLPYLVGMPCDDLADPVLKGSVEEYGALVQLAQEDLQRAHIGGG
jgi:hypothetical protein